MYDKMNIESAAYTVDPDTNENNGIIAFIDGQKLVVPLSVGNRHYAEILRQVDAGELTIADAEV